MTQEEEFKLQNYRAMENRLMSANSDVCHAQGNLELAEEEIRRLMEENKALGEMYANTFAKLRDLQKEFSDMKANLHRAYNGLENYKNLKEELKQRDETIKQLKEALKALMIIIEMSPDLWLIESEWAIMSKASELLKK